MNIVLFGAPGSGKGTLGGRLSQELNIPIVSTGQLLREIMKSGSEEGMRIRTIIESGGLVDDDTVIGLIKGFFSTPGNVSGVILDGFPRTLQQAERLSKQWQADMVLYINTDKDVIIKRIGGRRVCEDCGSTYHIDNIPTKVLGVCDKCGGKVSARDDDKAETLGNRLDVYNKETAPILQYYKQMVRVLEVDGSLPLEEELELVISFLGSEGFRKG